MTLNDWHKILDDLTEPVKGYVENPCRQPSETVKQIDNTNLELHIQWTNMDASVYSKLLSIDFDLVFPFVIKVRVGLRSNLDKFIPSSPTKTPIRKKISQRKKTIEKSPQKSIGSLANDDSGKSIQLKECCVRIPLLEFDENGEVIQNHIMRYKRKHSSILTDEIQPVKNTPKPNDQSNDLFMCTSSSTPLVRNFGVALKQIQNEVRGAFRRGSTEKQVKRLTNRLTTTPRTSNDRKSGSQFNPRIRLLKLPENVSRLNKSKKLKQKNTGKKTGKTKSTTIKKPKPKAKSVANESELFENPIEIQKTKKTTTKANGKKSASPAPAPVPQTIVKVEER